MSEKITHDDYLLLFGLHDTLRIVTKINYSERQCKRYITYIRMIVDPVDISMAGWSSG